MALTNRQLFGIWNNLTHEFWQSATIAVIKVSKVVDAENPGTEARHAWADTVIADPDAYINNAAVRVTLLTNWQYANDPAAATDQQIYDAIVSDLVPT